MQLIIYNVMLMFSYLSPDVQVTLYRFILANSDFVPKHQLQIFELSDMLYTVRFKTCAAQLKMIIKQLRHFSCEVERSSCAGLGVRLVQNYPNPKHLCSTKR